jgi:glutamyl-tRNA synthetase
LPNHPTKDIGTREIILDENLYTESEDIKNLKAGDELRLMGLGNVQITKTEPLEGKYTGDELKQNIPKVQWVVQKDAQKIKILIPSQLFIGEQFNEKSLEEIDVFVEPYYSQLKEGKEIQFVRFGYCRKDSVLQAIYTHK